MTGSDVKLKIIRKLLKKNRKPLKPYFVAHGYDFNRSKNFGYCTLAELKKYIENEGIGSLHIFKSSDEVEFETIFELDEEVKDSDD